MDMREEWVRRRRMVIHIFKRLRQNDWAKAVALGHRNIIEDLKYYWKWKAAVEN